MRKLEEWLQGYSLPPADSPLYSVESANLQILRAFYALLAVTSQEPTPQAAVHQFLPAFPDFPSTGLPSEALRILGVARPSGPLVKLRERLQAGLNAEQAALFLSLIDED